MSGVDCDDTTVKSLQFKPTLRAVPAACTHAKVSNRPGHVTVKAAAYHALCLAVAYHACAEAVCTNIVQNTFDSGPGSLRAAVANTSDGDAITFCPSVTGTILLTSGELLITNGVTILGPGASVLAVSGNNANRVFHVRHGANIVIANLTIANGRVAASVGGGIWNDRSELTVTNCTISGNNADNGGGIFNDGEPPGSATLTVLNDTFVGNSATLAGGVFNDGSVGGSANVGGREQHPQLNITEDFPSGSTYPKAPASSM